MTGPPSPRAAGVPPRLARAQTRPDAGEDAVDAIYAMYQDYFALTEPRHMAYQGALPQNPAPSRAPAGLFNALGLREPASSPAPAVPAPVRRPLPRPPSTWRACETMAAEVMRLIDKIRMLAQQINTAPTAALTPALQSGRAHETHLAHMLERVRRTSYAERAPEVWAPTLAAVRRALIAHMAACIERSAREPQPTLRQLLRAQHQARNDHLLVVGLAGLNVSLPFALASLDPWADQEMFAEATHEWVALYRGIAHQAARLPPAGDSRLVVHAPHRYLTLGLTPGQMSARWLQRANELFVHYRSNTVQPDRGS